MPLLRDARPRVFADTNVLVYAEDPAEPEKRSVAVDLLARLAIEERLVMSPQVVGEYVRVVGRKFPARYPRGVLANHASIISAAVPLLGIDRAVCEMTIVAFGRWHLFYWDAQIWATAKVHGVDVILTEDCPCAELEGVRYVNPFAKDFEGV